MTAEITLHIAYLITHGLIARGAIQTDLLGRLAKQGFRIMVDVKADSHDELKI